MKTKTTSRKENAEATRTALLVAAESLFRKKGFADTSVDAVVQNAQVTKGALYHHFKDKRALFEALVIDIQQRVHAQALLEARKTTGTWNRVLTWIEQFLIYCSEDSYRRIVIVDGMAVLGLRRWREVDDACHIGPLSDSLKLLITQGEIINQNVELMAHMIIAVVNEGALCITAAKNRKQTTSEVITVIHQLLNSFRVTS